VEAKQKVPPFLEQLEDISSDLLELGGMVEFLAWSSGYRFWSSFKSWTHRALALAFDYQCLCYLLFKFIYRRKGLLILWGSGPQNYRVSQTWGHSDEGNWSHWQERLFGWVFCWLVDFCIYIFVYMSSSSSVSPQLFTRQWFYSCLIFSF